MVSTRIVVFLVVGVFAFEARAETIVFEEGVGGYQGTRDNSIYKERPDNTNGGHGFLYAGNNQFFNPRRALIRFDLSLIPRNARIGSVRLEITVNRRAKRPGEPLVDQMHFLHALQIDWGEGSVDAVAIDPETDGGSGAPAEEGDATWLSNFHNLSAWNTPGGDFRRRPSAQTLIGDVGERGLFTGPTLTADVEAWVRSPASNYGWILRGNETEPQKAYRFYSSEGDAGLRPRLAVEFDLPNRAPVVLDAADRTIGPEGG